MAEKSEAIRVGKFIIILMIMGMKSLKSGLIQECLELKKRRAFIMQISCVKLLVKCLMHLLRPTWINAAK